MNDYTATASNDRRCIDGRSLQKEHTDKKYYAARRSLFALAIPPFIFLLPTL